MSFEEEFDKIIRRKAEEEKYSFDENNWDKANQLLDADRNAARALKMKQLYLPAALVIVLGSVGLLTFNYLNKEDKKELAQEVKNSSVQENFTSPEEKNTAKNEIQAASKTEQTSEPAVANEIGPDHPASVKQSQASEISIEKVPSNSKNLPEINPGLNNNAVIIKEGFKENNSSTEKNKEASPLASTPKKEANQDTESGSTDGLNADGSVLESQPDNVINRKDEVPSEYVAPPVADEQIAEELKAEQLSAVYSAFPFELRDGDLMQTPFIFLKRYEDDYFKKGKAKSHYMNVELGANYLLGWDAKNGKDGAGFNWFGGFNYGRYISDKMSISIGLQAYNIANIKQPFYLVSNKAYDFGSTDIYTRVTSNQLYFVSVPLKFNYALNTTNTIGFGVNAGYLVNAKNSVSKYYVLDNQEKMINPVSTNREIYKGTSMMNIILSAHYKTKLTDRFALNAEFNYGLTDLFKNIGEIRNNEKPMGIRVSVCYTLFDK